MKPFTPRPYQALAIEHMLNAPRCGVWAGMGMGKTSATLAVLDHLTLVESNPVLVLAPLRVAKSTWPDEVAKWDFGGRLEIAPIVGTPAERLAALKRDVPIYSTNYENIPWLVKHYGARWPFRTVVTDESTRVKSFRGAMMTHHSSGKVFYRGDGGQRARALGRIAHTHVKRFIELTGTPSPNGLKDLWGQAWFLDAGERLGRTYGSFMERWFQKDFDGYGVSPLPFAQEQIQDKLQDVCLSFNAKDWFDLKDSIHTVIHVELPKKARQIYNDMEKDMFAQIGAHGVEAFNAATRTGKCLQLANGAAYIDDKGNFEEIHDAKLQALDSIIEEAAGASVLVAYHFKSDLARLLRAFPQGRPLDANPATIREWNNGAIPVLFAHPASAGHGLNLQDGGNIIAFFGHNWNLEERDQIIERIGPVRQLQAGHDRNVFIYDIVARNTVDELVLARHITKRAVQDLLLEAMKGRK
jgi:SNF2 family DNA or RNA helicase